MELSSCPITLLIIALNVIASIIGFNNRDFINRAIMWPYGVKRNNQYYRFITSGFVHANYMHLIFNMFTFYFFGSNLELMLKGYDLGGSTSYLAIYILGLIVSDIPTYIKQQNNRDYLCLGASGAVSAVVFASIIFDPWSSIYLYGIIKLSALLFGVLYIVYCIYMSKRGNDHVNHDAHLWGALFGIVFTVLLIAIVQPALFAQILDQLRHPSLFGN
jgi:membrane associated rhomboid family serine protease